MTSQFTFFESKDPEVNKLFKEFLEQLKSRQSNRAPDDLLSKLARPLSKFILNLFEKIFGKPHSKDKKSK
jgi:hypothetical protein